MVVISKCKVHQDNLQFPPSRQFPSSPRAIQKFMYKAVSETQAKSSSDLGSSPDLSSPQTINFQLPSHLQNQNVPFLTRDFMVICLLRYLNIDISWKAAILTGVHIPQDTWIKYRKWLSSDNIPQRFRNKIQAPEFPGPFNKSSYLEAKHLLDTRVSLLVTDNEVIAQLPGASLVSIHCDILWDDILLYKKLLEDQRVPVTWYNVEDGFHGWMLLFDTKIFFFLLFLEYNQCHCEFYKGNLKGYT